MGVYDTVYIPCPRCGEHVQYQSKAGDCNLKSYILYEGTVPVEVKADLHDREFECDECGTSFVISVAALTSRVIIDTED